MPISIFRRRRSRGFTLIELLVVLLLVGLSLGLSLSVTGIGGAPAGASSLEQLARQSQLAAEEAALSGEFWGLDFFIGADNTAAWRWLQRRAQGWEEIEATRLAPLASHGEFAADSRPTLTVAGRGVQPEARVALTTINGELTDFAPEVLFLPSRTTTAFTLRLGGGDSMGQMLSLDLLGRIWRHEPPAAPR